MAQLRRLPLVQMLDFWFNWLCLTPSTCQDKSLGRKTVRINGERNLKVMLKNG